MTETIDAYIAQRFQIPPGEASPVWIRKHGRLSLAMLYHAMGFRRGAEIGVQNGDHAKVMCEAVPGLELLCVDPWAPQPGYLERKKGSVERMDASYAAAQALLAPYNCVFIRHPSVVAAQLVPDRSLDFVYIDGNHLAPFVREDIVTWLPKVKLGGILAGHDYGTVPERFIEVKAAVDAYTQEQGIHPWYVLNGVKGDKMPSWFWVVR